MNKRGFTLVELLAVLGLLTIIALMGAPILINQISAQKEKNYENFVNDLCLSSEAYINHTSNIPGMDNFKQPGDTISIKVSELVNNNYFKGNRKNPKTKQPVNLNDTVKVTMTQNKTYTCQLITNSN